MDNKNDLMERKSSPGTVKVRLSPHHFANGCADTDGLPEFVPLVPRPWNNNKLVEDADAAFKQLKEDSMFKEFGIEVDPQWLLGASME
jgi:hypothetical protein